MKWLPRRPRRPRARPPARRRARAPAPASLVTEAPAPARDPWPDAETRKRLATTEAALPELRGLCETIHENEETWRSETPEEYLDTVPGNAVAKLLVLRCVRPDRFVAGCKLHASVV